MPKNKEVAVEEFKPEEVTLSFLRTVLNTKRPYGKFIAEDGPFIYVVSNTTGEPDLESFYSYQRDKAIKWLETHA